MADVTPDWEFERMKLQHQRKQIELNMSGEELRVVELTNELTRCKSNIAASRKALVDMDERIAGVVEPTNKEKSDG